MNLNVRNNKPILFSVIISFIFTCIFGVLSIISLMPTISISLFSNNSGLFHFLMQGCISLLFIFSGVHFYIEQRKKLIGIVYWCLCFINIFIIVYSFCRGLY